MTRDAATEEEKFSFQKNKIWQSVLGALGGFHPMHKIPTHAVWDEPGQGKHDDLRMDPRTMMS